MQSTGIEIGLMIINGILNGVLIWLWQQQRQEIKQLKETRCQVCADAIKEKASRTRVQELERRIGNLESAPAAIATIQTTLETLQGLTQLLSSKMDSVREDIAALKAVSSKKWSD